jgi:hypothetical protein
MLETKQCEWKDNKQYYKGKHTGISLIPTLFKIKYEDGVVSEDVYNLERAHDNANKYLVSERNKDLRSNLKPATELERGTADALKSEKATTLVLCPKQT